MKTGKVTVGAYEAKNKFSELLERVKHGAEVVITKHDSPVARLVPASTLIQAERKKMTTELRALSKKYSLKGLSVRELIDEGRR